MTLELTFASQDDRHRVDIVDDGKVAYAYLLKGKRIVGDVWLYNSGLPPDTREWRDPRRLPFANLPTHMRTEPFPPISIPGEVEVRWVWQQTELARAEVYLRGRLHAVLVPGVCPGWCRLAARDGPVAKVLEVAGEDIEESHS